VKRREFITLVGGAAAWPLAARAQQPAMPVIGFLRTAAAAGSAHLVNAFRQGLNEAGFAEGQNVAVEYRWADDQLDRVPGIAADLVRRRVATIVTNGIAVPVVKAATAAIPIIFLTGYDPVRTGFVTSLNRPGGNLTGVVFTLTDLVAKQLGLLHELVPKAAVIAVLLDPNQLESRYGIAGGGGGRSRNWPANLNREGRKRTRIRCRLYGHRASGRRRAARRGESSIHQPAPTTRDAVGAPRAASGPYVARISRGRWPDELRTQPGRRARREVGKLYPAAGEKGVATAEDRVRALTHKICKGGIDLAAGASIEDLNLHSHAARSGLYLSHCGLGNRRIARVDEYSKTPDAGYQLPQEFSRFVTTSAPKKLIPVRLPPGRARLETRPSLTGSSPTVNTIGVVAVADLAASAETVGLATITAT
jgi:hypothetical protein